MFTILSDKLSHLPVVDIAPQIAASFRDGYVPIITSQVASGKTLLVPAACSDAIPEGEIIYVLEPTRILVSNAAESLCRLVEDEEVDPLTGIHPADWFGCMHGVRSDDESYISEHNRIVFTTVGYALSSGLIKTAKNIIFDEAHETSMDLSLAKAIMYKRMTSGEDVRVAIMSATIDCRNEIDFWGKTRAIEYTTSGSSFPVNHIHMPAATIGESVKYLIEEESRKGILVFVSGKEEIKDALENIKQTLLDVELVENVNFDLDFVHGETPHDHRSRAFSNPVCPIKILVGTNVLESGINVPWVDGGVSSGETKILHVKGNVHILEKEHLPSWRITQQEGRVGRFKPGVFVLAARLNKESRPAMSVPDIKRLPLTELVFHCAKLKIPDPRFLVFSSSEQPSEENILLAIDTLVRYGFIKQGHFGELLLTEDMHMVENLPVSYQALAGFCEAVRTREIPTLLPLIAMIEVGDIRFDKRQPLWGDMWRNSDLVHQVKVIAQVLKRRHDEKIPLRDLLDQMNINHGRFRDFTKILQVLERFTQMRANYYPYLMNDDDAIVYLDQITKRTIFRAMMTSRYDSTHAGVAISMWEIGSVSNTSVCDTSTRIKASFFTGNVRKITSKNGRQFSVLENVTCFTEDDAFFLMNYFDPELIDPRGVIRKNRADREERDRRNSEIYRQHLSEKTDGTDGDNFGPRKGSPTSVAPKVGTLGMALEAAFTAQSTRH